MISKAIVRKVLIEESLILEKKKKKRRNRRKLLSIYPIRFGYSSGYYYDHSDNDMTDVGGDMDGDSGGGEGGE